MKLKELRERLNKWSEIKGADDFPVLVQVDDAILFPKDINVDSDDNYYSIRNICISVLQDKA
jgi:hypothetical protein